MLSLFASSSNIHVFCHTNTINLDEAHELSEMRREGHEEESEAHEPLISADRDANRDALHDTINPGQPQLSILNAGPVVRFLTLSAGISGLLFGYDTGVVSSARS